MSSLPMYKTCTNCGNRFSYNPSTGNTGMICPRCGRPADRRLNSERINSLGKLFSYIAEKIARSCRGN